MHAYLLLDRSGSMTDKWFESLSAINGYVRELAHAAPAMAVTLVTFDDPLISAPAAVDHRDGPSWFEVVRDRVRADGWLPVTAEESAPRDRTPLFDAVERLVDLAETAKSDRTVIVVMTDGEENASQVATSTSTRRRLDACRERGWQVVFLGADFDARHQASELGSSTGQALTLNGGSYSVSMGVVAHSTVAYAVTGIAIAFVEDENERGGCEGRVTEPQL
jgi:hypothetical protein